LQVVVFTGYSAATKDGIVGMKTVAVLPGV
jgi:hypothetical protein